MIHCLRQQHDEIAQIYIRGGYLYVTAGPAIATPSQRVMIYSAGSIEPGPLKGTADDIKNLRQLQQLPLSVVAARVVGALLKNTEVNLPMWLVSHRSKQGLWCTRCRVAVVDASTHRCTKR